MKGGKKKKKTRRVSNTLKGGRVGLLSCFYNYGGLLNGDAGMQESDLYDVAGRPTQTCMIWYGIVLRPELVAL